MTIESIRFKHNTFSVDLDENKIHTLTTGSPLSYRDFEVFIHPMMVQASHKNLWLLSFLSTDKGNFVYEYQFRAHIIEHSLVVLGTTCGWFRGDLRYFKEIEDFNFKPLEVTEIVVPTEPPVATAEEHDSPSMKPLTPKQYIVRQMEKRQPINMRLLNNCRIDESLFYNHPMAFSVSQYNTALNALQYNEVDERNIAFLNQIIDQCMNICL